MKIIALLDGGLGNKFNCLFSALYLSELYNLELHINNVRNNYGDFDITKILNVENYTYSEYTHTDLDTKIPKNIPIFVHKKYFNYNREIKDISSLDSSFENFIYLTDKLMIDETTLSKIINKIRINNNIIEKVNKFVYENNIDEKTLGVHIRCTDCPIRNDNIIHSISLLESNLNKKIFVCTDEKEIKDSLSKYPNVIFYSTEHLVEKYDKSKGWRGTVTDSDNRQWNYNVLRNENSTIEAFIELLILSRTNIITKNENNFSVKNISSFLSWAHRYKNYIFKP